MPTQSAFKSEKARQKVWASYDFILSQWPVPFRSQFINTHYGETHVLISGSHAAKPLVLLHGAGGNACMWLYNIQELSQHFCVYMIDVIGEPGKSAGTRPKYNSNGHALWLKEVLDQLGLSKVNLAGISLGGFLAAKFALAFPSYIDKLILLAPAGFAKIRAQFIFQAMFAAMIPVSILASRFLKYMSAQPKNISEDAIKHFLILWKGYKPNYDYIPVFTSQELSTLPAKTLLILGEEEVLYHSHRVAKRIGHIAPQVKILVLPQAGHIVSVDQIEKVNEAIIKF